MQTIKEKMSLVNLNGGVAIAKFDRELKKALDDINDPNTPATKERKVVLEVKIKADEAREILTTKTKAKATLVGDTEIESTAFLGFDLNGNTEAHEMVREKQVQMPLTFEEEKAEKEREANNVRAIR